MCISLLIKKMKMNDRQRLIKRKSLHDFLFNAFSRRERHLKKRDCFKNTLYAFCTMHAFLRRKRQI